MSEKPRISFNIDNAEPGELALCCPDCGGSYVYLLGKQERRTGDRGDTVLLSMTCEVCRNDLKLSIAEHKGRSFISWHDDAQAQSDTLPF